MSVTEVIHTLYQENSFHKPNLSLDGAKKALEGTAWADGLRGIAAVFVMSSHIVLCFARYIVRPSEGPQAHSYIFQKPFFRLVGQGPSWVALFFILSGFVNSLKPIKLSKAGNVEAALANLAVSSYKRSFRLFLPATAATIISWFFCQFGAYETARKSDAYWLYATSPEPSESWAFAFRDLVLAIRRTWVYNPDNPYDQPQWALLYLLQGSMFVFTMLLVTLNLKSKFRLACLGICYFWSFNWTIKLGDPMVGINVFSGIALVELHYSPYPLLLSTYSHIFTAPLALLSLFLMSFPAEYQSFTQWSNFLFKLGQNFAPQHAEVGRFWPTIGAQLLTLTIVMSPHLRRALSHRYFLWLGKISFPLYLLHGSFLRSFMAWLLFLGQTPKNMDDGSGQTVLRYPVPGPLRFVITMPIFFALLFVATHFWAIKIEPWFGWITDNVQKITFARADLPSLPRPNNTVPRKD